MSRDDDRQLRTEFMERLYEETENPTLTWVDPEPIGVRIGIEVATASTLYLLIEHLVRAGFVEKGYDDQVLLTAAGAREVLRARPLATGTRFPPAPLEVDEGALAVLDRKQIFLSHASADKALADLLRNTLVLGGVAETRIFYSSGRGTGIPSGEDVGSYLRRSLRDAGLVIELLSETFLTRPMCLMEIGGAWTLDTPTYPVVVPPLTREEATRQIGNVQMGVLGTDSEISDIFEELHDRLAQDLAIQCNLTAWNRAIADFQQQLPSRLAAAQAAATASPRPKVSAPIAAESSGDKITIHNISVIAGPMGRELHAEATNNDTAEHTATIKATNYGAEGRIVGTSDSVINQLDAGRTKTFSMNAVPDHVRAKVEVDMII
jgi:hypothetical protein